MSFISDSFFQFSNTINGEARSGSKVTQAVNPSNKQLLWNVPVATEDDLNGAVSAAAAAFPGWSQTPWGERGKLLLQASETLKANSKEMASLGMQETGKPINYATTEVEHSLSFLTYHGNHPELAPKTVEDNDNFKLTVRYSPIGVVAAICPWNYPLVLAIGKIAAALITGNCVIVKPSPFTPYSILKFTELVQSIFPPGVIQAVNGDDMAGPFLCDHPGVQKISFTGSISTGKKIMAAASRTLKRITLELGGNDACIVCPDVDVGVAAPQIAVGSFLNSGQFCMGSKRIYVHKDIYRPFMQAITDVVKSWKVSPSTSEADNTLGPVQNEMQYNIVKRFFEDSYKNGYTFALGEGTVPDSDSFVIRPAIIDNPPDKSRIVTEEPFGPIVPLLSWTDEDEVIRRVNDTNTGLAGSIWSADVERADRLAQRMDTGTVWINSRPKPLPMGYLAGRKESGLGGEWGTEGLFSYCNTQTVHLYRTVAPRPTKV